MGRRLGGELGVRGELTRREEEEGRKVGEERLGGLRRETGGERGQIFKA